jgi:dTDP-4-amino-4,6-dideoxygalactose transaminase
MTADHHELSAKDCAEARLVQECAQLLDMPAGITYARGSTGLYATLCHLRQRSGVGEVVLPALCCEAVLLAVLYAGFSPRFADIDEQTLCMTPATVEPLMSSKTRAVLVVHLFGIDAVAVSFLPLKARYTKALFIEDLAHALGGVAADGRPIGGHLDATLLSFTTEKIAPGDGGMMLFKQRENLPLDQEGWWKSGLMSQELARLSLSLRNLVHAQADAWRVDAQQLPGIDMAMAVQRYRPLIMRKGGVRDPHAALQALKRLAYTTERRYERYRNYREIIRCARARIPDFSPGATCWRVPVLLDTAKQAMMVTDSLRRAGFHASNHYFPLNVMMDEVGCPIAQSVARRIVNLWADDAIDEMAITATAQIINSF